MTESIAHNEQTPLLDNGTEQPKKLQVSVVFPALMLSAFLAAFDVKINKISGLYELTSKFYRLPL